jgi:hypothetical protein
MVRIYSNDRWLKENGYQIKSFVNVTFENTYAKLNFEEYDAVFRAIEKYSDIDYKHKELTNKIGHCSFLQLSTGMKSFFNYISYAQSVKKYPEILTEYKKIINASRMGPNMQYFLFKYANYYDVPFHFLNFDVGLFTDDFREKSGNPIVDFPATEIKFELDGKIYNRYIEFLEDYHNKLQTYNWRILK